MGHQRGSILVQWAKREGYVLATREGLVLMEWPPETGICPGGTGVPTHRGVSWWCVPTDRGVSWWSVPTDRGVFWWSAPPHRGVSWRGGPSKECVKCSGPPQQVCHGGLDYVVAVSWRSGSSKLVCHDGLDHQGRSLLVVWTTIQGCVLVVPTIRGGVYW